PPSSHLFPYTTLFRSRARALPVAARLGPRLARREAAVHLHLRRAGGEERAEHAEGTVVETRREREHERVDAVVPSEADLVRGREHGLHGGRTGVAGAGELGGDDGDLLVGERGVEEGLDRPLEPA